MNTLLEDKVILVTGAGGGIGRGIALAVAEAGGRVVATDVEAPEETAALVEAGGQLSLALPADVTDRDEVAQALAQGAEHFGRVDGLVANAGVIKMAPALEISALDHAEQFEVNVAGLLNCCQLAAERMIVQGDGGAIVTVAANAGKVGHPNMASYNATKAAVINLTRSLAAEWAGHRINVNAVCPGDVDTPMLGQMAEWLAPKTGADPAKLVREMVPAQLGRHVKPIEVGRVVAFLLSDHAAIIRGQAINVDGGGTPY